MSARNLWSFGLALVWTGGVVLGAAVQTPSAQTPSAHASTPTDAPRRTAPYDTELVAAFERLPVQSEGRVKPFLAFTEYLLLRLNERRSFTIPDSEAFGELAGQRLSSVEWALDLMLYPEQADTYPVIVVPDRDVLDLIGLSSIANTKRQRHSWNEFGPGIERLQEYAREYGRIEEDKRSRIQNLAVYLFHDLVEYHNLRSAFAVFSGRYSGPRAQIVTGAFTDGDGVIRPTDSLRRLDRLAEVWRELSAKTEPGATAANGGEEADSIGQVIGWTGEVMEAAGPLAWLPPAATGQEEWLAPKALFDGLLRDGNEVWDVRVGAIEHVQRFADAARNPVALATAGRAFVTAMREMSSPHAAIHDIDAEVSYLRGDWFGKALYCFLFGFLAAAASWLRLRSKALYRVTWALGLAGAALVVWGVVQRCVLLDRPPVSTLYETILFVTGVAVIVALFIEWIGRRRVALSLAVLLGAVGMFVAYMYESHKGTDTLEELRAVLRTNFWLGVHVTTVTIGYSATLLAGFIAQVFLFGKLFGAKRDDPAFYQGVVRMVYGVLCFATFFATFGTIAGGIWANDSWGRFWGWDPKENGALMIVLWQLVTLHGRMGGFFRNWGLCLMAVIGNAVVAFSWWHVNALGIGLHTYGFDASLYAGTMIFYGTQGLALGAGAFACWSERRALASRSVDPDVAPAKRTLLADV
ncbi:MAG: cytochrome c biogenesis protein CcsA [Planctomycetes bacterium]|nr:cytochrome c biogenesis protein CcsA [Planctomycetota bacterium]